MKKQNLLKRFSIFYLFLILISVIFLNDLLIIDKSLFLIINSFESSFLNTFFTYVTYFGDILFWIVLIILFWFADKKSIAKRLSFGFIVSIISIFILKAIIIRSRPFEILGAKLLITEAGSSFPSGHAQNSFLGATILGFKYKNLLIPLYILAFLVSISRVYLGVHYPLDILYGALNGIFIGLMILSLPLKKLWKKFNRK